jgi:hypothetical protein
MTYFPRHTKTYTKMWTILQRKKERKPLKGLLRIRSRVIISYHCYCIQTVPVFQILSNSHHAHTWCSLNKMFIKHSWELECSSEHQDNTSCSHFDYLQTLRRTLKKWVHIIFCVHLSSYTVGKGKGGWR